MTDQRTYRLGIVCVFLDEADRVLVALRKNMADHEAWQFPQGGVDAGESFEEALYREMREEIGCDTFDILKVHEDLLSYDFPKNFNAPIAKDFKGQSQKWYVCRFHKGKTADLALATDDEFVDIKWVKADEALKLIVDWKKSTYQQALSYFDLLDKRETSSNA